MSIPFHRMLTVDLIATAALIPDDDKELLEKPITSGAVSTVVIRKSSGGHRRTYTPKEQNLKRVQSRIHEFLDRNVYDAPSAVHGFVRKKSTLTNAQAHLNAPAILAVDIKRFFDSISTSDIAAALARAGLPEPAQTAISNVCTYINQLPTGFSTSPVLSNLVFKPVDDAIQAYANERELVYTRYADDITLSGSEVFDSDLSFLGNIIEDAGFELNSRKTRFQRRGHRQVVTGYSIAHSDHPRVPRGTRARLRLDLHYAKTLGLMHQATYLEMEPEALRDRIDGRISYLMATEKAAALRFQDQLLKVWNEYSRSLDDDDTENAKR